jgi:replicative DNA helicase
MSTDIIHIPTHYAIPHSVTHEKDVVSCFLNHPRTFDDFPHITEDHFHLPDTRTAFKFARHLYDQRGFDVTDVATLLDEINRVVGIDKVGGVSGFADLMNRASFQRDLPFHVERLNQYLAKRLAIAAGKELVRAAFEDDVSDVVEAASGPITAIHDALCAARPTLSTKQTIIESFAAYEARVRGNEKAMGIETIPEIDEYLRGLHPGRVIIIGAYSGGGKSVLSSQIITTQALDGIPVGEINYEMRERDSMDRKIIQVSRIPSQAFMDPLTYARENNCPPVNEGFMRAVNRANRELSAAPIHIRKPHNSQLRTLLAMIRKMVRENGVKVIAIDYLQKIRCKADSREAEITEISGAIFEIAGELGISILLLSQINERGDTKHGVVAFEDCDGYLVIEQERDKQAENFGQHYHILLAKDRHNGNTGKKICLVFDPETVRFMHGFVDRKKKSSGPQKKPGY